MSEEVQGQAAEASDAPPSLPRRLSRSTGAKRSTTSPGQVHRPGQRERSGHPGPVRGENFPECFKEYADLLELGPVLAHHAGHQQRALLEVVRRRPAQRQLQLRRPAPGHRTEQGGA